MPDGKKRRGFAAMSVELQRELAERGGRAVQEKGTGHRWTRAEARERGRAAARERARRTRA